MENLDEKNVRPPKRPVPVLPIIAGVMAVAFLSVLVIFLTNRNNTKTIHTSSVASNVSAASAAAGTSTSSAYHISSIHTNSGINSAASSQFESVSSLTSPVAGSPNDNLPTGATVAGSYKDALFFGDSLTQGLKLYEVIPDVQVFGTDNLSLTKATALAKGADTDSASIKYAVKQAGCKRVYIMLGINDLSYISKDAFINNYKEILSAVKTSGVTVYAQSLLPVSRNFEAKNTGITIQKIQEYNAALKTLCGQLGVKYADIYTAVADSEGYLPAEETSDGLHPSGNLYKKWASALDKVQ